jgi:hypothetical protein
MPAQSAEPGKSNSAISLAKSVFSFPESRKVIATNPGCGCSSFVSGGPVGLDRRKVEMA